MVDGDLQVLRDAIGAYPPAFRERDRGDVTGGTRAAPLNHALELARGQYFAVFDDDDLLFGNWVETFHEVALQHPGVPIRALVANQRLRPEEWAGLEGGFRTTSWPLLEFPSTSSGSSISSRTVRRSCHGPSR